MDIATKRNLENLVGIGERLLKKPVTTVNFETGVCEPRHKGTNEEALIRYMTSLPCFCHDTVKPKIISNLYIYIKYIKFIYADLQKFFPKRSELET